MASTYELRCRECDKSWGNQPRSICDDCFSPLEVFYDLRVRRVRRLPASRSPRARQACGAIPRCCRLPEDYQPAMPTGFTPLLNAPRLAQSSARKNLFLKNDAVCLPTLSFKDRVVASPWRRPKAFGFELSPAPQPGIWPMRWPPMPRATASRPGSSFLPILSRQRSSARRSSAPRWCASTAATTRSTVSVRRSPTSTTGDS